MGEDFSNKKVLISTYNISKGVELIKKYEGCHLKAYPDPKTGGAPITIGWGSTRRRDGSGFMMGNIITQKEADDLLFYDIESRFIPILERNIPYWNEMNQNQQGALLSFAYNVGPYFYGSSEYKTITQVLKNKEWNKVPDALYLYHNPGTKVAEGLKRRRNEEGNLWKS